MSCFNNSEIEEINYQYQKYSKLVSTNHLLRCRFFICFSISYLAYTLCIFLFYGTTNMKVIEAKIYFMIDNVLGVIIFAAELLIAWKFKNSSQLFIELIIPKKDFKAIYLSKGIIYLVVCLNILRSLLTNVVHIM